MRVSRPLLAALLAVAAAFCLAPAGGLVYDDVTLIAGNPAVRGPFDLGVLFGKKLWGTEFPYWRPLTQLALWLGWHGGGAAGIHVLALLAHLGAVVVVFDLARRLGAEERVAAAAALLFGVHPVQAESVAWCSAINDPLWGLCALLALRATLAHRARGGTGVGLAATAWFAFGLLAKETALVVPLLLAALVVIRRRTGADPAPARWWRWWPLAAVVALWVLARIAVFGDLRAGFDRSPVDLGLDPLRAVTLRIELVGRWLFALLAPYWPSAFRPVQLELSPASLAFLAPAALALAFALGTAIAWRWRHAAGLVAAAFFLVPLLPGLALPHTLNEYPVADRYLYVGAAGLALAVVPALLRSRAGRIVAFALAASFLVRTFLAVGDWREHVHFFDVHVARHPDNPRLLYTQAGERLKRYMEREDPADLAAAEAGFDRGFALLQTRRYGGENPRARLTMDIRVGLAWCAFARAAQAPRPDWMRVAGMFEAILREREDLAEAHIGLASCLANVGQLGLAERHLLRALELEPGRPEALANLELIRRGRR